MPTHGLICELTDNLLLFWSTDEVENGRDLELIIGRHQMLTTECVQTSRDIDVLILVGYHQIEINLVLPSVLFTLHGSV